MQSPLLVITTRFCLARPPPSRDLILELHKALTVTRKIPITRLVPKLTDESKDELERLGGLKDFAARYPQLYTTARNDATGAVEIWLTSPSNVKGALVDELIAAIIAERKETNSEWVKIERLWEGLPGRFKGAAREHGSLETALKRRPDVFEVDSAPPVGERLVRLVEAVASRNDHMKLRTATDIVGGLAEKGSEQSQKTALTLEALLPYVPCECFVPMVEVARAMPPDVHDFINNNKGGPGSGERFKASIGAADLEQQCKALFDALEQLPEGSVDLRVLGEAKEDVFVRFVGDGVRHAAAAELQASRRFAKYAAAPLGRALASAFAQRGLVEPVPLDQIADVIGPELAQRLPLQGAPSILVFERLQQFFAVDLGNYTVQLRSADGQPCVDLDASSEDEFALVLGVANTPAPRLLRAILTALHVNPPTIVRLASFEADVAALTTPDVLSELQDSFNTTEDFIAAHSTYFEVDSGSGELRAKPSNPWQLKIAALATSVGFSAKDAMLARVIAIREFLPPNRPTKWDSVARRLPAQLRLPSGVDPRAVFERFPEQVTVLDPMYQPGWLIQRAELPHPVTCHRKCETVADLLREIARGSVTRTNIGNLNNSLSRNALKMIKAFGGLETVLTQLPEWFEYSNPSRSPGLGFVRYIGHESFPNFRRRDAAHEGNTKN